MNSPTRHWAEWNEVTFVGGTRLLFWIHRRLGVWPFRLCLWPVVTLYWLLHSGARRASQDYLRRWRATYPHSSSQSLNSLLHFLSFADVLLDKLRAVSGHIPRDAVEGIGIEAVRERLRNGVGGLMITAHVGCLELCQAAADWVPELRINVLVHTRHAERFNRLLQRMNPHGRVRLLQVTEVDAATAMDLNQRIERGELVAIVGDRVPVGGGRTLSADFLGESAEFPVGPWVLASLLRCPVYLLSCLKPQGQQRYRLQVELVAERIQLPRNAREASMQAWVQRYAAWLQELVAQSPYQWFNFFDFWSQRGQQQRT